MTSKRGSGYKETNHDRLKRITYKTHQTAQDTPTYTPACALPERVPYSTPSSPSPSSTLMPSLSLSSSFCASLGSSESSSSHENDSLLPGGTKGTHKVRYAPKSEWDYFEESGHKPIDTSLALPHYRARSQPIGHRLNLFVGTDSADIKVKVCRTYPRVNFYLEVHAGSADVIVWLPSDFKGHIYHPSSSSPHSPSHKLRFSTGFVNHIMPRVRLNEEAYNNDGQDEVFVRSTGKVTFKMWDIVTAAPEKKSKETWKRLLSCSRRTREKPMNWDFLLED